MNTVFQIIDLVCAIWYSAMAYDVGMAHTYTADPRWSAEQVRANRLTMRASYLGMVCAVGCGASIVLLALLTEPFWRGPWWGYATVGLSILLAALAPLMRRTLRDISAQRHRLIG